MNKLKIYFDTSVINFLFADDAPEKRDITIEYFESYVKKNLNEHYISKIVVDEIQRTTNENQRNQLLNVIKRFNLLFLPLDPEEPINELATKYIKKGIIPEKKLDDALHVAISTIHNIDILLSWNYKHLANVNKERQILITNLENGYLKTPRLTNPMEVFND
ncbi:MAG: PIN domain-containing protein [Spirochaetales bacterium]|nr:PIN domain-containing protein [Spirochaetales bacterium]